MEHREISYVQHILPGLNSIKLTSGAIPIVWTTARRWREPGLPIEAPKRPSLPEATIKAVEDYFRSEEVSRVAPNRTAKVRNDFGMWEEVPRRWTPYSTLNLWAKFKLQRPEHPISLSKFYEAVPRDVSPTEKATDLCSDCELTIKVREILQSLRSEAPSADRDHSIANAEALLELFEKHKQTALDQHAAEESMDDIEPDTQEKWILDYKENVQLGVGPREEGHSFYNRPQRAIFGAVVRWKTTNAQTGAIEEHLKYYDCVSPILTKTAYSSIHYIKKLLEVRRQENPNLQHVELWMDNCGHFKSKELIAWALRHRNPTLSLNYTWPQHGKSRSDSRFGQLSRFLERGALKRFLRTTEDIVETIKEEQAEANRYRLAIGKPPIDSAQLIIEFPAPGEDVEEYEFVGVKSYFHYSGTDDGRVVAWEHCKVPEELWTVLNGRFIVREREEKDLSRYKRGFDDLQEHTRDQILNRRGPTVPAEGAGRQKQQRRKSDDVDDEMLPVDRYLSDEEYGAAPPPKRRAVSQRRKPSKHNVDDDDMVVDDDIDDSNVEQPRPVPVHRRPAASSRPEEPEDDDADDTFNTIVENAKQRRKEKAWAGGVSDAIWSHAVTALNKSGRQSADERNFVDVMAMMARDMSKQNGSTQVSSAELQRLAAERRLRPLIDLTKELEEADDDDS